MIEIRLYLSAPVDGLLAILALLLKRDEYRTSGWPGTLAELACATRKLELLSTKFVRCSGLRLLPLLFISYPGLKKRSCSKKSEGEKAKYEGSIFVEEAFGGIFLHLDFRTFRGFF